MVARCSRSCQQVALLFSSRARSMLEVSAVIRDDPQQLVAENPTPRPLNKCLHAGQVVAVRAVLLLLYMSSMLITLATCYRICRDWPGNTGRLLCAPAFAGQCSSTYEKQGRSPAACHAASTRR
jgi:hypothetical protein